MSGNYFATFGIRAYAGRALVRRTMSAKEPTAGCRDQLSRLAGNIWCRPRPWSAETFTINNQPFTVIGIAPPSFFGDRLTNLVAFWIPIADQPFVNPTYPHTDVAQQYWLDLIGRIAPGVDPQQIGTQMQVELRQWLLSPIAQRQDRGPRRRFLNKRSTSRLVVPEFECFATNTSWACTC